MRWCCIRMPCVVVGCVVTEKHYTAWVDTKGVAWAVLRVLSCTIGLLCVACYLWWGAVKCTFSKSPGWAGYGDLVVGC
jgi:hypothetical protein